MSTSWFNLLFLMTSQCIVEKSNTLYWLKKVVKKGYYGNESLGLAWDRVKVCQINPFYTTSQ